MTNSAAIRARWAIALTFFAHGFITGSWVPHIPLAKERLDVGTGVFGLALLCAAAGAILAMPLAGALINRYGSARVTAVTGLAFCAAFVGPILSPDYSTFALALFAFGATIGSMDVAMNAHGIAVEDKLKRPVMSSFHGMFSIGGMTGAALGAVLLAHIGEAAHAAIIALASIAMLALAIRFYLSSRVDKGLSGSHFAWPTRATMALGILCFLALMAEGAVLDWSAIQLKERFALDAHIAGLGYALFSGGMALTRLFGDRIRATVGAVKIVRWSAILTAFGMIAALAVPDPWIAIAAYVVAGIGVGNIAPILFAGGGRLEPDAPGRGIAAVTSLGYAGFLAGPPIIGVAAELTGVGVALGLTVIAALIIAVAAQSARAADKFAACNP